MNEGGQRFTGIDAIKVAGIVTIVLIHALPPPWDPSATPLERWLHQVTRFGVPGFLLASGFLYASGPADLAITRRRLRRILVPYLLASLLAQLWHAAHGVASPTGSLWKDLLFASSFGPYYYVFVIAGLVALTPAIARLPRPALLAATAALLAAQWCVEAAELWPQDFYWHLRNPLLWWAYFAVGWCLRGERARLHAWVAPRRAPLLATLTAAVATLTFLGGEGAGLLRVAWRSASWLAVYAILAWVAVAAGYLGRSPRWLRALSDATYAVYLYHLFFLYAAQEAFGAHPRGPGSVVLPFAAGLLGSFAFVALGRRILGARARDWLGA
jgi:surface polysaccharide O-acyltransferase-like enzyme